MNSASSRRSASAAAGLSIALLLLAAHGKSQVPIEWTQYQSPDWPVSAYWGDALGSADLNADGFEDLIVGEPWATASGQAAAGAVWVMYGPLPIGAHTHFTSNDPAASELMGEADFPHLGSNALSVGDVNGDEYLDLLVGAANYRMVAPTINDVGRAHLFFGPTFSQEIIFTDPTPQETGYFGKTVLLTDVTGDRLADVVIAAPYTDVAVPGQGTLADVGEVWIWMSETDLQEPVRVPNPVPAASARFGWSLDVVAVDSDVPNLLMVGTIGHSMCCPSSWGVIHSFRLPGLAQEDMLVPPPLPQGAAINFGDVVYCGDLNGDGADDLVVTAWGSYVDCQIAGAVLILDGPGFDHASHVLTSPNSCTSGFSGYFGRVTVATDVDRDGEVDLIVGDSGQAWGEERAFIYYGPAFTTTQELGGDLGFITVGFGSELAVGDYDGDGWVECAITAPEGGGTGSVYVHRVRTLLADTETISTSAGASVNFTLHATSAQAGDVYLAVLSISGSVPGVVPASGVYLPLNIDAITSIGLSLVNGPILPGFAGVLDAEGHAGFQLNLPPGSAGGLVGQTITIASVTATAGGQLVAGSSCVELVVGP